MSLRDPRSALGSAWRVLVGYLAVSLSLVLLLEVLFRSPDGSLTMLDSVRTAALIVLGSALGGALNAWLAGPRRRLHTVIVVGILLVESSALIATERTRTTLGIFMAGVALNVAGVLLGAWFLGRRARATEAARHGSESLPAPVDPRSGDQALGLDALEPKA